MNINFNNNALFLNNKKNILTSNNNSPIAKNNQPESLFKFSNNTTTNNSMFGNTFTGGFKNIGGVNQNNFVNNQTQTVKQENKTAKSAINNNNMFANTFTGGFKNIGGVNQNNFVNNQTQTVKQENKIAKPAINNNNMFANTFTGGFKNIGGVNQNNFVNNQTQTVKQFNSPKHEKTVPTPAPTPTKIDAFNWGAGSDPNVTHNDKTIDLPKGQLYKELNLITVDDKNNVKGLTSTKDNLDKPNLFKLHDDDKESLGQNGYSVDVNIGKLANGNEGIVSGDIKVAGDHNIDIPQGSNNLLVDGKELQQGQEIIFDQATLARVKRSEIDPNMYSLFTSGGDNIQILKDPAFGNWNLFGHVNEKKVTA